jgi:predicted DNA-binding protein (UPF0251 family)
MKGIPREYLSFVERILRDYPAWKHELRMLDEAITAACHTALYFGWSNGQGDITSEPERVSEAKEGNKDYKRLSKRVELVETALKKLSANELDLVELFCWDELRSDEVASILHVAHRSFWRMRERAFTKIAPLFLTSEVALKLGN